MHKTAREYLTARGAALKAVRAAWDGDYKELAQNFSPRRSRFYANDKDKNIRKNKLINNTPIDAANTLAAGMQTGMTSPSRPWMRMVPPDPEMAKFGPVREWLDIVTKKMYQVYASSNFYKATPVLYKELGIFGTAAIIQDDDFQSIARFTTFTAGEYCIDHDANGRVNTFFRELSMTVGVVVEKFGLENCSDTVKRMYEQGNYSENVSVNHLIEPVGLCDDEKLKIHADFKFVSAMWEADSSEANAPLLKVKGYFEFPVMAPRWETTSGDTYGNSPGMNAIGDAKSLQIKEKEFGKAVALMARPPTSSKTNTNSNPVNLIPGGHSSGDDSLKAIYQVDPRVNELVMDIQRTEERINRALYTDLFKMMANSDRRQITAREITERHEEKFTILGPVVQGVDGDFLDLTNDRTFNMLVRLSEPGWNGMDDKFIIPPPPRELQDQELRFEYISPMAQAQKMVGAGQLQEFAAFVGQVGQIKPGALDKFNEDKVIEEYAEALGTPVTVINDEKQTQIIREQRAEQQQQTQAMEMASTAATAAKDLGQADMSEESALAKIMGA